MALADFENWKHILEQPEMTAEEKADKRVDFWFSVCYHILFALGCVFIFGLLCFGLILADAIFQGNF